MELQNEKVKRGTDQPVYNYLLQIKNIDVTQMINITTQNFEKLFFN